MGRTAIPAELRCRGPALTFSASPLPRSVMVALETLNLSV